jgi:hypothetical protein
MVPACAGMPIGAPAWPTFVMQWRCNSLNVKSRNAARRLGFRFGGGVP